MGSSFEKRDAAGTPSPRALGEVHAPEPAERLSEELAAALAEKERLAVELEQARAQVLELAKYGALGNLTTSILHELNQPLMVIKAYAQLLGRKLLKDHEHAGKLQIIEEQSVRLESHLERLRRFARPSAGTVAPLDLNHALRGALGFIEPRLKEAGARTEILLAAELPPVRGNASRLEQLFLNLLANAYDALRGVKDRRVLVRSARRDPGSVEVLVGDSGVGVAEEVRPRIFDLFFTTRGAEGAAGLGLAVSRQIASAHGGRLSLVPDRAHGIGGEPPLRTVFSVILPSR